MDTAWELIMKRPGIKEPTGGSERGKESCRRKRTEAPSFRIENVLYFFLESSPKREKTTIPTVGGYFSAAAVFIKGGREFSRPPFRSPICHRGAAACVCGMIFLF